MQEQRIILNTSDESASKKTVTGWVSRTGRFFGEDERAARWDGCTHITCECGTPCERGRLCCKECRSVKAHQRYLDLPFEAWDGATPVYSNSTDKYYFDMESLHDDAQDNPGLDFQLVICKPNYGRQVEDCYFEDELPDDRGLSDILSKEAIELIDKLNLLLAVTVMSWSPGNVRTEYQETEQEQEA